MLGLVKLGGRQVTILNFAQEMRIANFIKLQFDCGIVWLSVAWGKRPSKGLLSILALQGHQALCEVLLDRVIASRARLAGHGEAEGNLEGFCFGHCSVSR